MHKLRSILRRSYLWWRFMEKRTHPSLHQLEEVGVGYGGLILPIDLIQKGWLCYSFGVGEDITFDLDLIERFGCVVHGFDPTPRAIAYGTKQAQEHANFYFHPYGLWSENKDMRFYNPEKSEYASYSILNLRHKDDYIIAPCKTLQTLMHELEHKQIDLIKMDIEGAEQIVLPKLIKDKIQTKVLCIAYDQPDEFASRLGIQSFLRALQFTRQLQSIGYYHVAVKHWDCTYVHESVLKLA